MYVDSVNLKSDMCTDVFQSFLDNISLTSELCQALERSTRGQGSNQNWLKARTCLITASVMGEVCRRTTVAPDNLLKKICSYTNVPKYVKSIGYGNANESVALAKYMQSHLQTCDDVIVETCGLLVSAKYPFLGASIDGLVTCSKCGTGLVEIKCPYGSDKSDIHWRNMPPMDCARDKNFFCQILNGKLTLKESHNYMFQIQGQMAVYELSWVDFVVYTKKDINVERIRFSPTTWEMI
ncbi:uncharacterized protein LOC126821476 [Patella vulgata]|uniref:uncharacterized protein LOC126821476 n=1 Tax=Patella vulgata TaxID=6465 RepID=UPI0024A8EF27|nr:uncharacterized protein LOC126821476 [Patella vulgata]